MEGRKGRGEQGRWRGCVGKGGVSGRGTFIHPHSSSPPFSCCCYLPLWSWMGGARWDTVWFSTVRKGGVWGALHAILIKGWERHARHTRLLTGLFPCLVVTAPTIDSYRHGSPPHLTKPPTTLSSASKHKHISGQDVWLLKSSWWFDNTSPSFLTTATATTHLVPGGCRRDDTGGTMLVATCMIDWFLKTLIAR